MHGPLLGTIGLIAILVALASCAATPGGSMNAPRYLATYFINNGTEGVFLAESVDGLNFTPLISPNRPILVPQVGAEKLTRDACLFRGPDQQWHMVWTAGWWSASIGIAHSPDLIHWSEQTLLPVMAAFPGALNAWAPEIAFDPASGLYIIFWSSTVPGRFPETEAGGDAGPTPGSKLNHRIYRTTTRDFRTYSPTELMYDPGFNCIDATLLLLPGSASGVGSGHAPVWLMFLKDETRHPPAKNIRMVRVADPLRITEGASEPITGEYWAEGPTAFCVGNSVRVLFDRYTDNRFGGVQSSDLTSWADISDQVTLPPGARHGSVQAVDQALIERVRALLASPSKGP